LFEGVEQESREDERYGDDQRECRCEAKESSTPETTKADTPGRRPLTYEHCGDDESGNHKEDVNADESPGEWETSMESDDE
jgi:hypothetical protein